MQKYIKENWTYIAFLLLTAVYPLIPPIRNQLNTLIFLITFTLQFFISIYILLKKNIISKKQIFLFFILSRIIIFPMQGWLSDDVYTYLWQGHLSANQINVYEHFPEDDKLKVFRNEAYEKMGNKNTPAIYPPLTVVVYTVNHYLSSIFSDSVLFHFYFWKLILLACEFFALLIFLKISKDDYQFFNIYLFSPLALVEIVGQTHNDGLLLPILGLIILLFQKQKIGDSLKFGLLGLLTGLGFLVKLIPAVIAIPILKIRTKINVKIIFILCFAIIILPFIWIYFSSPKALEIFKFGQTYYNFKAQFFSAPLEILNIILKFLNISNYWILAPQLLNYLRLTFLIFLFFKFKPKDGRDFAGQIAVLFLISFLISSKVHCWYFVPIIYLFGLINNKAIAIALSISAFSYYPYLFQKYTVIPELDIFIWFIAAASYFLLKKKFAKNNLATTN